MNPAHVLVVEDEKDYLELMARHLERRGYGVTRAANGMEAKEHFSNGGTVDILVTDLMMPEMDGLELSRFARERDPYLPIIVVSGVGTLETAIRAMRQGGAFDYLPKPLESIRDLSLAVERAVEYRQLHLERQRLQAQVLAEKERLNAVMANTGDAIVAADAGNVITLVNPAAESLLGTRELVGHDATEVLPAPFRAFLANWHTFGDHEATASEIGWPPGTASMASLTPIAGEGPGGGGWVLVLRDITQHKRMVELKMQMLVLAADRMRAQLAQAVATLVELNELQEDKSERFTGAVERIMNHLSRIRAWSDDLFDLVHVEAGRGAPLSPIQLGAVAESSMPYLLDGLVTEKGLNLELALDQAPPILAEPALARRLLEQLVRREAWKAPRDAGLRLSLWPNLAQVWVGVASSQISLAAVPDWRRFEVVFSDPAPQNGGTGLELALVKSIADRMGGQIWISGKAVQDGMYAVSFPAEGEI